MDALSAGMRSFPLVLASEGEKVRILAYDHGRGLERKLADLGLPVGCELTVMARQSGGRLVVARDDVRIALGAGMAHRILVAHVESHE
ncbi:MAG: ferrous iron transport protein A [Rhodospirillales bacterium]|nr:ferrous iron transport protein A [Rhodospirillales bacterium]